MKDAQGNLRLPPVWELGSIDLPAVGQTNLLIEYQMHNLSDADFTNSIPAVTESQAVLQAIAPQFGYNSSDVTTYNNKFRNVVFAYISPERLEMIYANSGTSGVVSEITKWRQQGII